MSNQKAVWGEDFRQLRQEVAQDPKALEVFLEKITLEDPKLMKLITVYHQDITSHSKVLRRGLEPLSKDV